MWTHQSMLSILAFSLLFNSLVQIANSSVFNLFGSRSLAIPRSYEARKPVSLMIRSNDTWPTFPYTVTINQNSSTPEWLRFSYGGQSGTYQQSIILSSLIGNLSATFARSPTDILNDMSMVGNQDVYILFHITPRSLDAKSFSLALDRLAASVQQWGVKEMDFVIGSGPQNATAEGVFQVRLGRGIFTAGTGISTSLPFSTLSIAATSSQNATSAPIVTATRLSSGLMPGNNSMAAGRSTNTLFGSSPPVSYLNSQASASANQSMAQSTKLNSSAMPASTIESHYTVLSALISGATVSPSQQGSFASGSAALPARNITNYRFSPSAPSGSSGAASNPRSMSRSIAGTGFGSLNMSVISTGCSAGLCPPRTNSSQPMAATTTTNSLASSSNATTSKHYIDGVGNIVPLRGASMSGTGLVSTATVVAASTGNVIANSSIPVSSSAVFSPLASSSVASSSQSSVLSGSTGNSSPVPQSSSSIPALILTSSPSPGSVVSPSGTATVISQSSVVGLEAVEASVAANKNQGNKDNNFNGLCPGILCPVCPGCLAGAAAGEYPGPAGAAPFAAPLDSGLGDPNGNNDPSKPRTGDNLSNTQGSGSQTATLASSTVFPSSTVASSSFAQNSSTIYPSSSIVSQTVSSNVTMTSQSPSSSCSACAMCQGFSFSAGFPTSNSTNSSGTEDDVVDDDGDQGDWVDQKRALAGRDIVGGKLTGRAHAGRSHPGRALAGRLSLEERNAPLAKRAGNFGTKTHLGACSVTPFTNKPKYPEATNVKKFEGAAGAVKQGASDYAAFFATATYWAVPSNRPKGDCRVPDWSWKSTAELGNVIDPETGKGWVVGGKGDSNHVNIDHVYEAHFLYEFFEDLLSPGGGLGLKQFTCDDVDNLLDIPDKQDTNTPQGTRLNTLFDMLANFQHPEFIGMDQKMNELKERITRAGPFGPDQPLPFVGTDPRTGLSIDPATDMSNLAKICIVLDMLNTPKAVELFTMTHARIFNALRIIADLPTYFDFDRSQHGHDLGYIVYMAERFDARNKELQAIYNSVVGALPTKQLAYWDEYKSSFTSRYPVASMTLPMDNIGYYCHENINIGKRQAGAIACPAPTDYGANNQRTAPDWLAGPPRTGTGVSSKGVFGNSGALNGAPIATSNGTGKYPQYSPAITTPPLTSMTSISSMASTTVVTSPVSSPIPPASSSTPAAVSAAANPDPCGPAQQEPAADFFDTCNAKVNLVQTPSQYGVMCQSSGTTSISYDNCAISYTVMCKNLASSTWTDTDEWVWLQEKGCAVGVYIPGGAGSAQLPSQSDCVHNIFKAMVDSCHTTTSVTNLGSVNIAQWPSFTDKKQTGQQVNSGYPSYMIAPAQPAGLGSDADGWTTNSLAGDPSANEIPSGDNSGNLTPGQIAANVGGTSSGGGGSGLHVARCPANTCYTYCVCQ